MTAPEGAGEERVEKREPGKDREKSPLPKKPICRSDDGLEPACSCFPGFLQLLLRLKGWTPAELGWVTGLDESYLRDLGTKDKVNPTLNVLSLLARGFGIKLERFIRKMENYRGKDADSVPNVPKSAGL